MLFIIIGVASIIAAIILFVMWNKAKSHVLEMKYLKTSKVKETKELHSMLLKEVGSDGVKQLVEMKGTSRIIEPLFSEITKTECIGYSFTITENYDEEIVTKDKDGGVERKTNRGSNTVASNSRFNNFILTDDTGEITIDPNGAEIDMTNTTERFEPFVNGSGNIQFGSFTMNVGFHPQRRITGYNIKESILPANKNIYIIGELQDINNIPIIRKSSDSSKPFIISQKSEEETIKQKENSAKLYLIIAIASSIVGIGLSILGIIRSL